MQAYSASTAGELRPVLTNMPECPARVAPPVRVREPPLPAHCDPATTFRGRRAPRAIPHTASPYLARRFRPPPPRDLPRVPGRSSCDLEELPRTPQETIGSLAGRPPYARL